VTFSLSLQYCERATERVRDYRHVACIDLGKSTQESEPGSGIAQVPVLQQPQLQGVAGTLSVRGEFAVPASGAVSECLVDRSKADIEIIILEGRETNPCNPVSGYLQSAES
jgi:hypothetical protein